MSDAELRALIADADDLPWEVQKDGWSIRVEQKDTDKERGWRVATTHNSGPNRVEREVANAELIVAAVNALPGLLDRLAAAEADAARLSVLLDDANDRCHDTNQKYNALCLALKTHAGDTDGYEFGLGRVKFKHGNPVSFLWAGQDEIDAAIDAARAAIKETK